MSKRNYNHYSEEAVEQRKQKDEKGRSFTGYYPRSLPVQKA